MDDSERIEAARLLFERYLKLLRAFDLAAYELFADEAKVTSTRRGIITVSWTGKQFRELIGPIQEAAKSVGRTYDGGNPTFRVEGKDVLVSGSFQPATPGQSGLFTARIRQCNDGQWRFAGFNDGTPVEGHRLRKTKQVDNLDDESIEIEYKIDDAS